MSRAITATTTKDDNDDALLVCPLCIETMMIISSQKDYYNGRPLKGQKPSKSAAAAALSSPAAAIQRDCCQQYVCQSCLYRHVHSILEEGIVGGAGRTILTCPLGCGREMTDADVRACFHHQHQHHVVQQQQHRHGSMVVLFWNILVGSFNAHHQLFLLWLVLAFPLDVLLLLLAARMIMIDLCCGDTNTGSTTTRAEQNDLRQYERWSLAVALHGIQRQEELPIVMHCPSPNCDYAWLVANPEYRQSKVAHERRKVYLWYIPPKPEQQAHCSSSTTTTTSNKTSKKENDDTSSFDDWYRPEFLNMSRVYNDDDNSAAMDWLAAAEHGINTTDGRYMCCAKCHVMFCGLCRQPWRFGSKNHVGISCRAYRRQLPAVLRQQQQHQHPENGSAFPGSNHHDAFAFVATTSNDGNCYHNDDGRCCPGCSMFTSRTGGCNHMTCPCGVEWCYACEHRWHSLHYGCVGRRRRPPAVAAAGYYNGGAAATVGCIIS